MSKDGLTFAIETLPWQECARLIQNCNARNRPLSEKRVETITRAMKQARFLTTHQGIALDPSGQVIDGQHRLASAARSKTDLRILVCRYLDHRLAEEAMAIFDSGRSRSTADGLAIGGIMPKEDAKAMTAVVNVMASLMSGAELGLVRVRLDLQETGEFYRAHRESVAWAVTNVPSKRGGAYVRAAFAIAWEVNHQKTAELAAQINEGTALPNTAAALWHRAFADGYLTTSGGVGERRDVTYRALRIIKAHVAGEKPPAKLYTTEDAFLWFMAQRGVKTEEAPPSSSRAISPLQTRILDAIPATGARLTDIAIKLSTHEGNISHTLAKMVRKGLLSKPKVGFYVPVRAAA